jgi:hypothetical protein
MQFTGVSDIGPGFWAHVNKQILVNHNAVLGQTIDVTIKQKSEKLVFSINGNDEIFPVPFKAGSLE